jgi:hypothetical protein
MPDDSLTPLVLMKFGEVPPFIEMGLDVFAIILSIIEV